MDDSIVQTKIMHSVREEKMSTYEVVRRREDQYSDGQITITDAQIGSSMLKLVEEGLARVLTLDQAIAQVWTYLLSEEGIV